MDILGYNIDVSFIYSAGPIMYTTARKDAYRIFFELLMKDGRSHSVERSYNYTTMEYRGATIPLNINHLNGRQLAAVPKKFEKDMALLKSIRSNIVKAMEK